MTALFKRFAKFNNSLRNACLLDRSFLWKKKVLAKLTFFFPNSSGKANTGRIVARFCGSRARKRVRLLYSLSLVLCVPGRIIRVEYDPNRSGFISLVLFSNGVCFYVLHTLGLVVGELIRSHVNITLPGMDGLSVLLNKGDACFLFCTPTGTVVHSLDILPFSGGSFIRSSGTYGLLVKKFFRLRKCFIRLPSTQQRSFSFFCSAVKGVVGNSNHSRTLFGTAGRHRLRGYKPVVRGVAQNPVDHAHGGGEGKKSKKSFPRTAWGKMLHWRRTGVTFVNVLKRCSML